MDRLLELGQGLAIYRFDLDETVEQDVNARTMRKEAFDRLTQTVKDDQRLESLPLMALTDRGLEIVSGHHRTRALRTAGLTEGYAIVDETGLSRDEITAKQLAHNAIQGYDDPQLLARLFESIGDVDARLEAFVDPKSIDVDIPRIRIEDIELGMRFETVIIMFIPFEKASVKDALRVVEHELDGTNTKEAWLADLDYFEAFRKVGRQITREYDIHTMSTVLYKMAELAQGALGKEPDPLDSEDRVPLRDIMGAYYIPQEAAAIMQSAIEKLIAAGDVTPEAKWRAFELLAADYLGSK